MKIYVVDTETTGLDGIPHGDLLLEIAIIKVNTEKKKKITPVFHSLINYEVYPDWFESSWIFENSDLTPEMVQNEGKPVEEVAKIVKDILKDQWVTSFNTSFDLDKYLRWKPWEIKKPLIKGIFPCIMLTATKRCAIPGYYDDYK